MANDYTTAFKVLIKDCLNCTVGEQVAIIFDDYSYFYIPSIVKAASDLKINISFNYLPVDYQMKLIEWNKINENKRNIELPIGLALAINESQSIINILSGDLKTLRVRRSILDENRSHGSKLAHIPGLNDDILKILKDTNIEKILNDSENCAWALGQAKTALLITEDSKKNKYELSMDLEGWKREPIMSPGIIMPDSWGNIPPGETFICPNHKNVNGSVCINGSLPDYPLKKNEDVVLFFKEGRLILDKIEGHEKLKKFFIEEKEKADRRNDLNWNLFAEVGIGLNPAIKKLTGENVFDEKMAGTMHIAIGDNEIFGFEIRSTIHADMIIINPSLILDNRIIVEKGFLNKGNIESWRSSLNFLDYNFYDTTKIRIYKAKIGRHKGALYRKLNKKNRIGYVKMCDSNLSILLSCLADTLFESKYSYYNEILESACEEYIPNEDKRILNKLINILHNYDVIELMR